MIESLKLQARSYAGIGSRATPEDLKPIIKDLVKTLNDKGFVLRSGGAQGADTFFEEFANPDTKEIFLPWPGFNRHSSGISSPICKKAKKLASKFHPAWDRLKPSVQNLIARNGYQILGENLDDPVEFVLCWTPNGKTQGGTAQAIRIANFLQIPVFNLYNEVEKAEEFIANL